MLIKEYRIPMPLSVDEYRIAQLYMIAKKSKNESQGAESGVEIHQNEPYTNGPGGDGQYTYKIYHVGQHLPAWMKSLLPKSALTVEEMAWNSYPYTKTRYTCPFVEKFSIEIETKYFDDCGNQDNVFNLPPSELDRPIDVIDIVRETLPYNEGLREEDLKLYISQKTNRGPLTEDWLKLYIDNNKRPIMCAYKLCKVEFKYWGMQNKIEKFIHDMALRKTMLTAHQQAWVWQDEWVDLKMDDIRKLEIETQAYLKKRMESHLNGDEQSIVNIQQRVSDAIETDNDFIRSFKDDKSKIRSDSRSALHSPSEALDVISTLRLKSLVTESDSDSDQTFYDAEDDIQLDDVPVKYIPHPDVETDDDISSVMSSRTSNRTFDDETLYGGNSECSISTLIIIFHGGALIDSGQESEFSEGNDVKTFRKSMDFVIGQHYTHLTGKIAIRSVQCHEFCHESRKLLSNIAPDGLKNNTSIPIGALPICAIVSKSYPDYIADVIARTNTIYKEFVNSHEGKGFMGKVCLIADSIGAIVVYDALCQQPGRQDELYNSQNSILERINRSESPVSSQFLNANSVMSSVESLSKSRTLPTASALNSVPIPTASTPIYMKSLSHPGESVNKQLFKTDSSIDFHNDGPSFIFEVNDFFMFGSLVGLVLTFRKIMNPHRPLIKPNCQNIYNLFHATEPSALRLEPLLVKRFTNFKPVAIPRHSEYPLGDGTAVSLTEYLCDENSDDSVQSVMQRWWGKKRIDYQIYSPHGLTSFPTSSLPLIFHASYWESNDVIAFILRQFNRQQTLSRLNSSNYHTNATSALSLRSYSFRPRQAREKWRKKRTSVKIGKLAANHRANDVIVCEKLDQTITGRFMYGPLDLIALNGEAVDIYMKCYKNNEWTYLQTVLTDKSGRVSYKIPKILDCGLYKFRMLVRGDHTILDLFMAVVPARTEAVVFSIDGSLTASFSVLGRDPKVRPGAVDVVRFWQERGYLIIYITGRPDIQQSRIVSWMSQHNFPHGLVYFLDGFTTDPVGHKADYLKSLKENMNIIFAAGYGSSKDVHMYEALNLPSDRIYTVGKVPRKLQTSVHCITEGYASHLRQLQSNNGYSLKFQANPRAVLPKGSFCHKRTCAPKNIS